VNLLHRGHSWRALTAVLAILTTVGGALTGCGQGSSTSADREGVRTVRVGWFPAFAHNAGFFAAMDRGLYDAARLKVEMVPLFGHDERMAALRAGRIDFVVTHAPNVILDRQNHPDVKVVAVLEQRSPLGTYSPTSAGIDDPRDYAGHTLASNPGSLEFRLVPVMARLNGIDPASVTIKELDFSVLLPALLDGQVDMITGFWASGAHTWEVAAEQAGRSIKFVRWSDYGWDAYGDSVVTTEDRIREDPQLVRQFLDATLRGFDYLTAHPDEVVGLVRDHSDTEQSDDITADWERTAEALVSPETDEHGLGWVDPARMQTQASLVFEAYQITGTGSVDDAYSNDFLPGPDVNGK
jgi:NitT/TauT family transport system substrate-binding protein